MGHTLTIRIDAELAEWLAEAARRTGMSQGKIVRDQLERARRESGEKRFMKLAGTVRGASNLSERKGFSEP